MAVPAFCHLKWAAVLMDIYHFIVDGIQLPLWAVACLTSFQIVGALEEDTWSVQQNES
jgi:hypothetical protein